jgi:hypothetical protein
MHESLKSTPSKRHRQGRGASEVIDQFCSWKALLWVSHFGGGHAFLEISGSYGYERPFWLCPGGEDASLDVLSTCRYKTLCSCGRAAFLKILGT